jgi:hypothetical protein
MRMVGICDREQLRRATPTNLQLLLLRRWCHAINESSDPAINTPTVTRNSVERACRPSIRGSDGRQNKAGNLDCNPAHVVVGVAAPQTPLQSGDAKPKATHTQPLC